MTIPNTRNVWRIAKAGSLNRLQFQTESIEPPERDEFRVSVKAVGLNFADIFACQGLYSATPAGSFIPGLEFSGVISQVGDGVNSQYRVGQSVMGVTRFGGYATEINTHSHYIRPLPEGWSFVEGAGFLTQGLTAWYGLKTLGNLQPGQTVLVQSAAGGVGLQALEVIRKTGAVAIGTIGSSAKQSFLEGHAGLSPDQIIVRNPARFGQQLQDALKAMNKKGFDLIFDAIYGNTFRPAYDLMNPAGKYLLFGAAEMMSHQARPNYLKLAWQYVTRPRLDPLAMISDNKSLMGFNLIWLWDQLELMNQTLTELSVNVTKPPHIGHVYPFEQALDALFFFQAGSSLGKVVLENKNS